MYIHSVKKLSASLGVILAVCMVGMLVCISSQDDKLIRSLTRAGYGKGQTSYQLDVEYDGTGETVEIVLDPQKHTEQEILDIFSDSYDAVIKEMLSDNTSLQDIHSPLNLIGSYGQIRIHWDIEDVSLINYNGELSGSIGENEHLPVSIYATFTMEDTSQTFSIPLVLTAQTPSDNEKLAGEIMDSIARNNSAYDPEVTLPDSINGRALEFRKTKSNTAQILLILGVIGAAAVFLLYDKRLEKEADKRRDEMTGDFSEIVFKLSLLYEAGLSIFRSWERIVTEYEASGQTQSHYAYREMRYTLDQIRNGRSEAESYGQFGKRCGLHQYIRLGNILEQNLQKGAKGMKTLLRQEAQDSFEERKRLARRKGEEASTKLLIPMIMMLVVVMAVIAVPAVLSIGF